MWWRKIKMMSRSVAMDSALLRIEAHLGIRGEQLGVIEEFMLSQPNYHPDYMADVFVELYGVRPDLAAVIEVMPSALTMGMGYVDALVQIIRRFSTSPSWVEILNVVAELERAFGEAEEALDDDCD